MIANLQPNVPMFIQHFNGYGLIYIKIFGAGNLRLKGSREELLATVSPLPVQDGISQATADGFKQYFWKNDLWVISDAPGSIVWEAPGYTFYLDRGAILPDANNSIPEMQPDSLIDSTYGRAA